jgi:hypothetical protein
MDEDLFFALKRPSLHLLTGDQISAVEAIARSVVFDVRAAIPNRAAHDRVARIAQIGETVPYFTVFSGRPAEILRADIAWAIAEAGRSSADQPAVVGDRRDVSEGRTDEALDALLWHVGHEPSAGISLPNVETSWFLYKQLGCREAGVPDMLIMYKFDLEELIVGGLRIGDDAGRDDFDEPD